MLIIRSLFHPPDRKSALKGAEECLHLLAPHFAHVHDMSFRIKYLCAVAIKPFSNHQKKLANVSIAAYFLLGPAIAPDMWAFFPLGRRGQALGEVNDGESGQQCQNQADSQGGYLTV
jgi:hypothetical protein